MLNVNEIKQATRKRYIFERPQKVTTNEEIIAYYMQYEIHEMKKMHIIMDNYLFKL